jgi:hypothetical protein
MIDLSDDGPIDMKDIREFRAFEKKMRKNFREGKHPPADVSPWFYPD